MSLRRSLATSAVERSWLVGLCALVVYVALASPNVVDGDNAELATLGALGGRAHPSGYPAYVLWLRAWSWLPGATPAHTAAIATAVLGALAIAVLHAACRAWGVRPIAATITVAIIGAAPIVERYHCEAEVFALNNLVAALVVWLAAANGPLRGRWRGFALGLVAGLGLANHMTCVLVAPIGLLGVVRAARESRPSTLALAIAGLTVGLTPYAYLVIAGGPASWGTASTPGELLAVILRRQYGGATSFLPGDMAAPWAARLAAWAATLARSWLWVPAIAGVAMLGMRIRRPIGETRWGWAALALSFVLAGPVLALQFNVDSHGMGLYVCQRFHVLPALLLAVPVAAAIDLACAWISRPLAATALAVLGFVALSIAGLPRLARLHSPAMELGVQNLVVSLPPGAIAVVLDDDQCLASRYLQLTRAERLDVVVVCLGLLPSRWYRAALVHRGLAIPPGAADQLGDVLLHTGRPVFVDLGLRGVLAPFPGYPFGVVRRILPRGTALPPASEVALINRELYRAFELDYPHPGIDDEYAALAHHRYAASWAAIASRLAASGDHQAARDAFELTGRLKPVDDDGP